MFNLKPKQTDPLQEDVHNALAHVAACTKTHATVCKNFVPASGWSISRGWFSSPPNATCTICIGTAANCWTPPARRAGS